MSEKTYFPFHYGEEADSYTFYRIPKALFENPELEGLSTDAKLLYGLLLDRMQLSIRNQWFDESGRAYIYFTVEQIMERLHCGNKKVSHLLAELDDRNGVGLITRIRQGQGKADKIYVRKCSASSGIHIRAGPDLQKADIDCENYLLDQEAELLRQEEMALQKYTDYREYFKERISYDVLLHDYPYEEESLDEIIDLLVEVSCSDRKMIRVGGEDKPVEIVKSKLMKLNSEHIRYVMGCLNENTTEVRNIRQYLLTTLYNAPSTISHYYRAKVNHDMYGGFGAAGSG